MANALTTLRLLLVLPFAWLMASPDARHAALAAVVLAAAIVTDLLDGFIARRRSTAGAAAGTGSSTSRRSGATSSSVSVSVSSSRSSPPSSGCWSRAPWSRWESGSCSSSPRGGEELPRRPPEKEEADPRVEEHEEVVLDEPERRHLARPLR